jgi:hypothetical protein
MTDAVKGDAVSRRNLLMMGAVVGLVYGFGLRVVASLHLARFEVMTVGFICFMPFALGYITMHYVESRQQQRIWTWWLLPWVPVLASLAACMLALLEGWICVVMFAPLALALASIGGLLGGLAGRMIRTRRTRALTVSCVMVLPFLTAVWEKPAFYRLEERRVENVIDIQAPTDVIWHNIERVRAIHTDELPKTWTRAIGFPNPVEATLSYEGVGGVRNASFTGGLVFIETVDVWQPNERLAFSIVAQTDKIPATTLDEHVRVGGPYFDALHGEYRLEPREHGVIRLHLSSQHRVSTDFNWYAHLWTDAIMSDLQQRILQVIRKRCQAAR